MGFFKKIVAFFTGTNPISTVASTRDDLSHQQQITITRVYDSNRQKVWEMWTKPEKLCEWFGVPPVAATRESTSINLVVGGIWQADMINAVDGTRLPFGGVYREIEAPRKLVFTIEDRAHPENTDVETVTVTFADYAGTTQMTMHQEGHLPADQYGEPLRSGYSAFFERMSKYLASHN
jgi:uncharacterized protein YndB with AHSA1/START domain